MHAHLKGSSSYATLGLDIVLSVVFGFIAGRYLDGRFDTAPYLTIAGTVFGVGAAVRFVVRAVRKMHRQTENDDFDESQVDRPLRRGTRMRGRSR